MPENPRDFQAVRARCRSVQVNRLANFLKRCVDVIGASAALLVFALPMAGIAMTILVTMGRPVLFRQRRPGLGGRPFIMYKFRTMRNITGPDGNPLPDEKRLTQLGRWLRETSVDELPELWNVLKGDMSLVGPRPLLMEYLERYTPEQGSRHEVKPGITGWAQVHGRNLLSWEQRFEYDVWYVNHWSCWLDMNILARTIWKVLQREGISAGGHATMPEFVGEAERRGQQLGARHQARKVGEHSQ